MSAHLIGEISLNVSTVLYFLWFIPQIALTFKRASTDGLSLWMHGLLVLAYLSDLVYGFGQHLPIQYRLVTISGLCYLMIEHYQFARYGLADSHSKLTYGAFSLVALLLLLLAIYDIAFSTQSKLYYNLAGMLSATCWFCFFIPQIIKNYYRKSSQGLSTKFVWLAVFSGTCDVISAYALNWPWPSKVNAPLGLLKKSIVLAQCYYYASKPQAAADKVNSVATPLVENT